MKLPIPAIVLFSLLLIAAICPKPTPTPPAPVYVTVTVCTESGLLPNPFCPATEARQFLKGKEPTMVCTIHQAPVPPPVCSIPYRVTGKLLVVADACLTLFCTKDGAEFKAADIPDYLDAITVDGVTAVRGVIESNDATPGHWESYHWGDAGYEDHLRTILAAIKARDLTAIICVTPYGGASYSDAQYNQVLAVLKDYLPNVIISPINEPTDNIINQRVVTLALASGWPAENILCEFVDSSDYYSLLHNTLGSKASGCLHFVASMADVNAPWPNGWTTSDGMMRFVHEEHVFPSTDGGTHGNDGQFPFPEWQAHPEAHCSSPDDAYQITKWIIGTGGRGFELLSKSMFADGVPYPNARLSITAGAAERQAMRRGYGEGLAMVKTSSLSPKTNMSFPLIPGAKRPWRGR